MSRQFHEKIVIPPDMDVDTIKKTLEDIEEILYTQYYMNGRNPDSSGYWSVYKDKLKEALVDRILLQESDD